jgi:hypothetical protein
MNKATSNSDVELVYHIQIELTNTGQGYIAPHEVKQKFNLAQ